jgi:hypothetical protein
MTTGDRRLALRFAAPAAGLAAMIALALLYHLQPHYYWRVLAFIGIEPFRYPFLDFQFILASVDCWQRGTDVYVNDPCDVLGRPFNYSPLWLRLAFLPSKGWTNPLGLCLATSFFLALAVLPPPRTSKELLPRLVATISPVTTYAVERGNIDLLMFLIATAAGVLLLGPLRRRIAAYAMIVIAGLLKIYPLALMVLTLRERPRVFLWVNAALAAVVLSIGIYFYVEVVKMLRNLRIPQGISEHFGARLLPDLVAQKVETAMHPGPVPLGLVRLAMFAALFLAMTGWFFRTVHWRDFRIALARLPEQENVFLLIGAAIIGGCFFAGSSIGYRGIYLLFTLPALLAMGRMEADLRVRRLAVQGSVLVVALTWAGFFIWNGLFPQILESWIGDIPVAGLWFLNEIAWWQVATLFIAILIGCCSNWFEAMPEWGRLLRRGEVGRLTD